ncbi:amidohydrolase family protein [Kitasatospora sp. NBC_01250]|uniref:amidohydrolase family protein n=1 Tax=Kitasatospora sp. NBC_01250 TaxID=2903571 RepID=UPI002E324767|nr:amidohydrolase family protein [Kitasatospora sp. NBC_01250]
MLKALRAGGLFDGTTALGPGTVLVEDGRIKAVDTTGARPPEGAEVIDHGADAWILPGLIDTHVHLVFDAGDAPVDHLAARDDDAVLAGMRRAAARALAAGITTVRDLGDRGYLALRLREEAAARPYVQPHIVAAGPPITSPGGHCHFLGGEAWGREALVAAVRERHERGCEVVKVMASGGHMTPGTFMHLPQYPTEDLRAVVDEAHRLGMRTATHVHSAEATARVLDAGFDTLEHLTFFTEDGPRPTSPLVERVIGSGATVSLTVGRLPGEPLSPLLTECLRRLCPTWARLHRAGVAITAGTDAGICRYKPHDVLPYAVTDLAGPIGMTPAQALAAVTSVAAAACALTGVKGCLKAGADADLLVVGGNPLHDLTALRDVRCVYRIGHQADSVRARPAAGGGRPGACGGGPGPRRPRGVRVRCR